MESKQTFCKNWNFQSSAKTNADPLTFHTCKTTLARDWNGALYVLDMRKVYITSHLHRKLLINCSQNWRLHATVTAAVHWFLKEETDSSWGGLSARLSHTLMTLIFATQISQRFLPMLLSTGFGSNRRRAMICLIMTRHQHLFIDFLKTAKCMLKDLINYFIKKLFWYMVCFIRLDYNCCT